jgi:hypothetical protein
VVINNKNWKKKRKVVVVALFLLLGHHLSAGSTSSCKTWQGRDVEQSRYTHKPAGARFSSITCTATTTANNYSKLESLKDSKTSDLAFLEKIAK